MRSPHLEAELSLIPTSQGGRQSPIYSGYRGQFHLHGLDDPADVEWYFPDVESLAPGTATRCHVSFIRPELHLRPISVGDDFEVREGARTVGLGTVTVIIAPSSTS